MVTRTLSLAALVLAIATVTTFAQVMPDPSQIAGVPLPAPELSDGSVSVRLVRERMGNNVADHPVTLKGADYERVGKTDGQGRAIFTGLKPGTVVRAEAVLDGETLQSRDISVPPRAASGSRSWQGLQPQRRATNPKQRRWPLNRLDLALSPSAARPASSSSFKTTTCVRSICST